MIFTLNFFLKAVLAWATDGFLIGTAMRPHDGIGQNRAHVDLSTGVLDHTLTFRATMTATRPMEGGCVRALYAYEVPSSTEWAFGKFYPRFDPNHFVDITSTLDRKIRAMAMYETEGRAFPHPRSPEALEAIARKWGSTVGLGAAEAFQQIWKLE